MEYRTVRLIDKSNTCEIYEIEYGQNSVPACMKVLKAKTLSQVNIHLKEIVRLAIAQDHPLSLKYYDSELSEKDGMYSVCIVMEYCGKGTLKRHLLERARFSKYYTEEELQVIIRDFITYFKKLQLKNISHRDIKPENIFITDKDELKIGDFGSSTIVFDQENFTIAGTLKYLSPELHEGYMNWHKKQGGIRIVHCPYRSDVYSLGLVLMYMATFVAIDERFLDLNNLNDLINEILRRVNSLVVRKILRIMLNLIPNQRPDFIELHDIFEEITNKKFCYVCEEICESNYSIECINCRVQYHKKCKLKNQCLYCNSTLSLNCLECGRSFVDNKLCEHCLCDDCSIRNIDCVQCLGFKIMTIVPSEESKAMETYKCFNCSSLALLCDDSHYYNCSSCGLHYCAYCKDKFHPNIKCLTKVKEYYVMCGCGIICSQQSMEIFFNCQVCGYRCLVCMGNISKQHFDCIKYLL